MEQSSKECSAENRERSSEDFDPLGSSLLVFSGNGGSDLFRVDLPGIGGLAQLGRRPYLS